MEGRNSQIGARGGRPHGGFAGRRRWRAHPQPNVAGSSVGQARAVVSDREDRGMGARRAPARLRPRAVLVSGVVPCPEPSLWRAGTAVRARAARPWYGRRSQGGRSRPWDSDWSWLGFRHERWRSGGDASTVLSLVFAGWCRRKGVRRRILRLRSRVRNLSFLPHRGAEDSSAVPLRSPGLFWGWGLRYRAGAIKASGVPIIWAHTKPTSSRATAVTAFWDGMRSRS